MCVSESNTYSIFSTSRYETWYGFQENRSQESVTCVNAKVPGNRLLTANTELFLRHRAFMGSYQKQKR